MKKRQPSPAIANLMEKFQGPQEQSTPISPTPNVSPKEQTPPHHQQPTQAVQESVPSQRTSPVSEKQQSTIATQESPTPQTRVSPPRPPRAHERKLSNQAAQDSQTLQTRTSPPRPPRARDRELSNQATQDSQTLQAKFSPPKPPRAKAMQKDSSSSQDSAGLYATAVPPKPPRTKAMQKDSSSSQDSEGLTATAAPPKPPRTKAMQKDSSSSQDSAGLYATAAPPKPPRTKAMQKDSSSSQDSAGLYAAAAAQKSPHFSDKGQKRATLTSARITSSLSPEEILDRVRSNALVLICKDSVRGLSQTVYGNPDIFNQKLAEIEKSPSLGESLSWQVADNPKLVGRLAGKKVLGIKNQARKEAEQQVPSLCFALENYAETVKRARENIFQARLGRRPQHRASMDLKTLAEDLQKKPHQAEQERDTLSPKELARRVKSQTPVKYCHSEVTYWCAVAFNDPGILQYRIEDIEKNPAMGEEVAWQVTHHPQLFGKLAGRNFHGFKSNARKEAESALPYLGEAIEGYAEALKHAKEHIVETHQQQQRHTPSSSLERNLQQQDLSKPHKQLERSPENLHPKAAEASLKQAEKGSLEESLQPQHPPLKPHKKLERTLNVHQKAAASSLKQAEKSSQDVRPRKVEREGSRALSC